MTDELLTLLEQKEDQTQGALREQVVVDAPIVDPVMHIARILENEQMPEVHLSHQRHQEFLNT